MAAVEEALEKGPYIEILEWPLFREKHLVSLAFRAQKFEQCDGLSKAMMGGWRNPNASEVSQLQFTVKTHKEAGEVEHRCIHACAAFKNEGFGRYLAKICRIRLQFASHLVNGSQDFLNRISSVVVPNGG